VLKPVNTPVDRSRRREVHRDLWALRGWVHARRADDSTNAANDELVSYLAIPQAVCKTTFLCPEEDNTKFFWCRQ